MADTQDDKEPHRHAQPKDKSDNKDQQRGQASQGGQTNHSAYTGGRDQANTQRP